MKPLGKRIAHSLTRRFNARLYMLAKSKPPSPFWDRVYHETFFFRCHGRYPRKPWLFNDYLHKMKVDGTLADPLRVRVTDKELSKRFVTETIGEKYAVPTIAVLRNADEIDAFEFPDTCFIKATHGCGSNIHKKPGDDVDRAALKSWLSLDYYQQQREANYKGLHPKIIVEPVIFSGREFSEYRVFCWHGAPRITVMNVMDHTQVKAITHRVLFNSKQERLPFSLGYPAPPPEISIDPPANFSEILAVSAELSKPFSLLRVDVYSDGKDLFIGELTNCHAGATQNFLPRESEGAASKILFSATMNGQDTHNENLPVHPQVPAPYSRVRAAVGDR